VTFEDLNWADALQRAEAGAAHACRAGFGAGVHGFCEFAQGSVSHDVATHARRPLVIVPPVTT
jgi:hypothetical protein